MAITDVLPYVGVDEITGDKVGLLKALVAEMIGTLFLVVVGCGSCYANPEPVSDNSLDKGCVCMRPFSRNLSCQQYFFQ